MHQTRQEISNRLPIQRKGTKYIVRASDHHSSAVPLLMAVRDMLGLARTAREAKEILKNGVLEVNWKKASSLNQGIKLFNVLKADKFYRLTFSETGKFIFEEVKESEPRLCKVINKKLINDGKVQINLHDGTNFITSGKINVGDSVYIDKEIKMKKHVTASKGSEIYVIEGKYTGKRGKIIDVKKSEVKISINGKEPTLKLKQVVLI